MTPWLGQPAGQANGDSSVAAAAFTLKCVINTCQSLEKAVFDQARPPLSTVLMVSSLLLALAGCDAVQQTLGIETPAAKSARLDAEGKAVGGACRQSGRAIEDCYSIYSWLAKAAIYEGWRDMDVYMRENKLETVDPQLPPPQPPGTRRRTPALADDAAADPRSDQKGSDRNP